MKTLFLLVTLVALEVRCFADTSIFNGLPEFGLSFVQTGPLAASLENGTDVPLLAFVVRWTFQGSGGHPPRIADYGYLNWHERDRPAINAHSSVAVSIDDRSFAGELRALGIKPTVTIAGAVFADGTVVGVDPSGLRAELAAKWQSEDETFTGLSRLLDTSSADAAFAYAQELIAKAAQAGPDNRAYAMNLRGWASEVLRIRDRGGPERAIAYIRLRSSLLPRVTLH